MEDYRPHKVQEEDDSDNAWLTTFADLSMLLLVFFCFAVFHVHLGYGKVF